MRLVHSAVLCGERQGCTCWCGICGALPPPTQQQPQAPWHLRGLEDPSPTWHLKARRLFPCSGLIPHFPSPPELCSTLPPGRLQPVSEPGRAGDASSARKWVSTCPRWPWWPVWMACGAAQWSLGGGISLLCHRQAGRGKWLAGSPALFQEEVRASDLRQGLKKVFLQRRRVIRAGGSRAGPRADQGGTYQPQESR